MPSVMYPTAFLGRCHPYRHFGAGNSEAFDCLGAPSALAGNLGWGHSSEVTPFIDFRVVTGLKSYLRVIPIDGVENFRCGHQQLSRDVNSIITCLAKYWCTAPSLLPIRSTF